MIIVNKKRMTMKIIKHPRVYVIVSLSFLLIGLGLLTNSAMSFLADTCNSSYYWDLVLGIYLTGSAFKALNAVSGHIVSAFKGRSHD